MNAVEQISKKSKTDRRKGNGPTIHFVTRCSDSMELLCQSFLRHCHGVLMRKLASAQRDHLSKISRFQTRGKAEHC